MPAFWRRSRTRVHSAPAGVRVYAIGDVHGRADLLNQLLERIERDHAARPAAPRRMILLGDLVDRGPHSREVVETVRQLCADGEAVLIKGNHEEILVQACWGDAKAARALLGMGGGETLRSYGLSDFEIESGDFETLAQRIARCVPRDHVALLQAGRDQIVEGDYLFVHAGVRPGVPLEEQDPTDLRWIRGSFLRSTRDHGYMVVHGHTPTVMPEIRSNRIGIDTGAFRSGVLTAIGLEGSARWFLQTEAPPA